MTRQTPRDEEDRLPEARDNLPFAAFVAFLYVYLCLSCICFVAAFIAVFAFECAALSIIRTRTATAARGSSFGTALRNGR